MTDKEFEEMIKDVFGETVTTPLPKQDPRYTERRDNPTPSGGDYSIAYYYDDNGMPTEKENASFVNIIEFKSDGTRINEHYASLSVASK